MSATNTVWPWKSGNPVAAAIEQLQADLEEKRRECRRLQDENAKLQTQISALLRDR